MRFDASASASEPVPPEHARGTGGLGGRAGDCASITAETTLTPSLETSLTSGAATRSPNSGKRKAAAAVRTSSLRVMITDASYKHTLAIARSLGRRGHHVTVLARRRADLAARSRYCAAVECVPNPWDCDYAAAVVELLQRNPHDVLVPVGYPATLALASEEVRLAGLVRMGIASFEQIRFAADKRRVHQLAARLGVPVPASFYPRTVREMRECLGELARPAVLKPRCEGPKGRVRYVSSMHELPRVLDTLRVNGGLNEEDLPMIQEFIPGHGCGFFALYQNGVCKRVFMHRRIREDPPTGGASCCAESFYSSELRELSLRLLDELKWHGVAMVEFRYDKRDNSYKLLEINPKFWGSLDLALAAGVDFPADLCEMARGTELAYSDEYQRGLAYHWPLSGEIQHVMRRPASAGRVVADLLNPRVKSNIWPSDLGPNLQELCRVFESLWARISKG